MQKRLKEIVIYILENSSGLGPEHRAQLEAIRDQLGVSGFPAEVIEEAIHRVLELNSFELSGEDGIDLLRESDLRLPCPESEAHLRRFMSLGLLSEDQVREIRARARRLYPEGVDPGQIRFLAGSVVLDENLAEYADPETGDWSPRHPWH